MSSIVKLEIQKYTQENYSQEHDSIAVEEPLEISIETKNNGVSMLNTISITMRTTGNDDELAMGFLFTEGILTSYNQVECIKKIDENRLCVILKDGLNIDLIKLNRHFYTSSSCGVCGKSSIDAIRTVSENNLVTDSLKIPKSVLFNLNNLIKSAQKVFESTGGLHASALFNEKGELLELQEDVGRHNALDKLIGSSFMLGLLPLHNRILFLSGRASFELIQKAVMAGIPVVCALGAPSSLAIELAKEFNVTLLGFLKHNSFNLYSGFDRVS